MLRQPMELPVKLGEIVAKKYRIDRVIGAGGMGVVVAAFHLELEQPVAIKFLNGEAAARADSSERFRREARAAARIRSEHVARVLDIELLDERIPYMVMELLEGNDLEQELERGGALPAHVAVDYVLQALEAVAEAHVNGIVHRDLKPTNLFLARRPDGSRLVKVLDFGISKLIGAAYGPGAALTRSASIFGSPLYMSPEQMRSSKDVDARSDIWSVGAILYELIAGKPPFVADSMPALCVAILNDTPQPLHEAAPSAPPALDEVLSKCLAREVSARFDTVADLAEALAPFAPGGYVHAERARRTLGHTAAGLGATARLGSDAPVTTSHRSSLTPAAPSIGVPPQLNPTHSAWGKTEGRAIVNRRVGTVLLALALLGGGGLLAKTLLAPADTSERARAAQPVTAPPPVAPIKEAPTLAAEAAPAPPEPPPVVAEVPSAAPVKPPSQRAVKAEPRSAPAEAKKPARSASPREKAGADGAALTDFGGRIY
ncbi:MAG: serine/threonine protein kinase [Myxococcales bacterium]|nr:MAG: serine/threonine protein kinase [Myxococcales bacterium]